MELTKSTTIPSYEKDNSITNVDNFSHFDNYKKVKVANLQLNEVKLKLVIS